MSDSEEEENGRYLLTDFEETGDKGEVFYFSEDEDNYETDSDEEMKKEMVEIRKKLFKVKTNNGYIFNEKYAFPEELLSLILSYVDPQNLVFNCRTVCKNWCNIIDSRVWKLQLERNNFVVTKPHELGWVYYYWILSKKNVFNRNLVKNSCGQDGLEHWERLAIGPELWKVEKPPVGCAIFPQDIDKEVLKRNSCFGTRNKFKSQAIDLKEEGATPQFMDIVKPKITFTDWYCGRSDCLSSYSVHVQLINGLYHGSLRPVAMFHYSKKIGGEYGSTWHKVSQVFENYKRRVEHVLFEQFGRDSTFRKGRYGCKVTGTSVVLSL